MHIKVVDTDWSAEAFLGELYSGYRSTEVMTTGNSEQAVLEAAQTVLEIFCKGRSTVIRVYPEADTYTDFDTKETKCGGYVRFSFSLEPGDWIDSPRVVTKIPSIGEI